MTAFRHNRSFRALMAAGLVFCCFFWFGCSVKRDYKVLTFFFDGVPDPNATTQPVVQEVALSGPQLPTANQPSVKPLSTHKPYAEQQCKKCHTQGPTSFTALLDSNMCMQCHEKVLNQHPAMHGPVIGKACLWCHEPHESAYKHLMRTESSSLCMQCHEPAMISQKTKGHENLSESKCLSCHTGHGGEKAPFLRPESEMKQAIKTQDNPASQPGI